MISVYLYLEYLEYVKYESRGKKSFPNPIVLGSTEEGIESYANVNTEGVFYINGYITGVKWECVEFVRRYMINVFGLTFINVPNALSMKNVDKMIDIYSGNVLKVNHLRSNISSLKKGDIIIIDDGSPTGHVVVVTRYKASRIEVAEQNYNNESWNGKRYSRVFSLKNGKIISNNSKEKIIDVLSI